MDVAILSDDLSTAERLRSALVECQVNCPIDRVRSVASATGLLSDAGRSLDALFFMLEESEESLTLLEAVCSTRAVPVIAIGTARDPQFIMRVIHAGPSDYLDIDGDLSADLRRAIGRLQKTQTSDSVSGKLISVFSHCGGSGCSLIAANLAVALAERHQDCLLCDFNVRRGDLATVLNLKPQFSINDVCKNVTNLKRDIFEQALTAHSSGVQLLAAPSSFSDVRPIPMAAVSQIIGLARRSFPITVTDLEDFFHAEQAEVLKQSDRVLFVMRLDYTAVRNARRTFEYLEREGVDGTRFRFVVNQYGRPRELPHAQAEEVLGRSLDYYIPYEPKIAIVSMNRGIPLMESSPRSKIARALGKLADEIVSPMMQPVVS
jgi:pilus assembly protein CpaE